MVDHELINLNALAGPENAEAMAMVAELNGVPAATDEKLARRVGLFDLSRLAIKPLLHSPSAIVAELEM